MILNEDMFTRTDVILAAKLVHTVFAFDIADRSESRICELGAGNKSITI